MCPAGQGHGLSRFLRVCIRSDAGISDEYIIRQDNKTSILTNVFDCLESVEIFSGVDVVSRLPGSVGIWTLADAQ